MSLTLPLGMGVQKYVIKLLQNLVGKSSCPLSFKERGLGGEMKRAMEYVLQLYCFFVENIDKTIYSQITISATVYLTP